MGSAGVKRGAAFGGGEAPLPVFPDRERLLAYLRFLGVFCLVFFPVYAGCGWLTATTGRARDLYVDAELAIPLMPGMVWPYLSLYPLFLLPLFHLDPDALARLSRQSVATLLIAGLAYVLVPGRLGHAPVADLPGVTGYLLAMVRAVDTPHNMAPSLHVAFSVLILSACMPSSRGVLAVAYPGWMALMAASALLIHQHHIVDVVTGAALALAVRQVMPLRASPVASR